MKLEHLEQAMEECRNNDFSFNNGKNLQCFLYRNTWYPMIAVVQRALEIANEATPKINSREALFQLSEVLEYVRHQKQNIQNNELIDLTPQEKLNEVKKLTKIISEITES